MLAAAHRREEQLRDGPNTLHYLRPEEAALELLRETFAPHAPKKGEFYMNPKQSACWSLTDYITNAVYRVVHVLAVPVLHCL